MKKALTILITILLSITLGCSLQENNKTEKAEVNKLITTLKSCQKGEYDESLNHDERVKMTEKFIDNLSLLLKHRASTRFSDEKLQNDFLVVSKTKAVKLKGKKTYLRIVRYDALPEINGTLERRWIFIQWWDENNLNVQLLTKRDALIVSDFFTSQVMQKETLILSGYNTSYYPSPMFLWSFQLKDEKWNGVNIFSKNIKSNDNWDISISDNRLFLESKNREEIYSEINEHKNGFIFSSSDDSNKKIEFKLVNDQLGNELSNENKIRGGLN